MENILELQGVDKSFSSNRVLKSVSIGFGASEVHAVVGENGAGKSTLMKIIGGIYSRDAGEIVFNGTPVEFSSPSEAMKSGISIVHQELSLAENLTVAQNIFSHREPVNPLGFIKWRQLREQTQTLFDQIGVDIDPNTIAGSLNVARQQLVEIAKALSLDAKVIIMDEPTSSLSEQEVDYLYEIIRQLKEGGVSVVFISHKLSEVFRVADRISVMRDGELIGTVSSDETTTTDIIRMMVGRHIEDLFPRKATEIGARVMAVEGLGNGEQFNGISFELRSGEILGLAGLVGAQRSESMLSLFGAAPRTSGEVTIYGERVTIESPRDAVEAGLCYLPEDRRTLGLFQSMSTAWNVVAASLDTVIDSRGFYDRNVIRSQAASLIELLDVNPRDQEILVRNLSGGNQQKALLGKWLAAEPRVLIVDEPTRGVDVGAKSQIHQRLRDLASSGIGIIVISSEQPEIVGLCDRVLVYREGKINAELEGDAVTQEGIVEYAT